MSRGRYDVTMINDHPRIRLPRAKVITDVLAVLKGEHINQATLGVILTTDRQLRKLNKEFLGHDYNTDVISFGIESSPLEAEVYISIDRARVQARQFGVGLLTEVRRLAIHGTLHVTGYDDATSELREQMRIREDYYLFR